MWQINKCIFITSTRYGLFTHASFLLFCECLRFYTMGMCTYTDPEINLWETGENFRCVETTFHGQINNLRWTIYDIISLLKYCKEGRGTCWTDGVWTERTCGSTGYVIDCNMKRHKFESWLCRVFLSVPFTSYLYLLFVVLDPKTTFAPPPNHVF